MSSESAGLTWDLIAEARARIADKVHRTPVMTSETLDSLAGAQLYFKCENLQKTGAFKARGATNAVFALTAAEAAKGVATHSSGNHAAALARAAKLRGIPAHIVIPHNAPKAKLASVSRYGGRIIHCEPTLQARESTVAQVVAATGATLVHPYNDLRVMAGQGTTAIELLEDIPDLDLILCPVGGGGQLGGIAVAAKTLKPAIRVIGVEPAGADDAFRSFRSGTIEPMPHPNTIADGLRSTLGAKPFAAIRRHVDDIVTVSEESIVASMRRIWEVLKIIVEPSGAVPYAAIASDKLAAQGKKVGVVLSGGNLDLDHYPWINASRATAPHALESSL
ncbi:MAG TPA: pyridoxal-phosphate dependent enzyme [Steroidobacteraceae bacterium]|nr:pyridoxal-phosphate dependent enzyme [Steroidobacteraceae bacterium]